MSDKMVAYVVLFNGHYYGVYSDRENAERVQGEVMEVKLPISWHNTYLQFARLIAEIEAAGGFCDEMLSRLEESMDLDRRDIDEVIEAAVETFDKAKDKL
jgi:hypothetical protein